MLVLRQKKYKIKLLIPTLQYKEIFKLNIKTEINEKMTEY